MKIVIEISEEQKKMVDMILDIPPQVDNDLISAIRHGTPLSEVLEEIKGEIEVHPLLTRERVLNIIDKHIGKESNNGTR